MQRLRITVMATLIVLVLPFAAAAHHHRMHDASEACRRGAHDPVFVAYERGRQAIIDGSLAEVRHAAAELRDSAHKLNEEKLAAVAAQLERAADREEARDAFAVVSDEAIRYRNRATGSRPAVFWCAMERKSWMQPPGPVENPYVEESMRSCGELVPDGDSDAGDGDGHNGRHIQRRPGDRSDHHARNLILLNDVHWLWMAVMLPLMLVMML